MGYARGTLHCEDVSDFELQQISEALRYEIQCSG